MERGVLLLSALQRNVAPNLAFAAVLADRTEIGAVRPEFTTPEVLLDRGGSPEHFPQVGEEIRGRPSSPFAGGVVTSVDLTW